MARDFQGAADLMKKKSFIRSGEGAIASYDWTDIADGSGMVDFYAVYIKDGETNEPSLLNRVIRTTRKYFSGRNAAEVNFDSTPMNTPRTLKGTAYISYVMALNRVYTGTAWGRAKFEIIRLRGAIETSLGFVESPTIESGAADWSGPWLYSSKIELTETLFAIGDILRLKITITARTSGMGDIVAIFTNPLDESETSPVTTDHSQLKASIPFKIDL